MPWANGRYAFEISAPCQSAQARPGERAGDHLPGEALVRQGPTAALVDDHGALNRTEGSAGPVGSARTRHPSPHHPSSSARSASASAARSHRFRGAWHHRHDRHRNDAGWRHRASPSIRIQTRQCPFEWDPTPRFDLTGRPGTGPCRAGGDHRRRVGAAGAGHARRAARPPPAARRGDAGGLAQGLATARRTEPSCGARAP